MRPIATKLIVMWVVLMVTVLGGFSAYALPSLPHEVNAQVIEGHWDGGIWPKDSYIGVSWNWDLDLSPELFVPDATAEWWSWQSPLHEVGLSILNIWGIPSINLDVESWTVQTSYAGTQDWMYISAELVDDMKVELQLEWVSGTLEQGILPGTLGMDKFLGGAMWVKSIKDGGTRRQLFARVTEVHTVPEPISVLLLGPGLFILVALRNRFRKR